MIKRLINNFTEFSEKCITYDTNRFFGYIKYLFLRLKYGIGIEAFFENNLWDDTDHSQYYHQLHTYIHKWSYASKHFSPSSSMLWLAIHYFDYLMAKLYCPGLDAMDYFRYNFWEYLPSKRRTFITEGGVYKMSRILNGSPEGLKMARVFRDKPSFNSLFSDIVGRKWLETQSTTKDQFLNFCKDLPKVICKPTDGGGGKGIFIEPINNETDAAFLYEEICNHKYIVEEVIEQHEILAKLNPSSVNTLRICSVNVDGEIAIISATLRIGNGVSVTDNYSSGGLAAEIDINDGIVVSRAVSQSGNSVFIHPTTQVPIIGTVIPEWGKILSMVISAHSRVPQLGYIGWDVVVCKDRRITFLEANTCAGVELQQHASLIGKKKLYSKYLKSRNTN